MKEQRASADHLLAPAAPYIPDIKKNFLRTHLQSGDYYDQERVALLIFLDMDSQS